MAQVERYPADNHLATLADDPTHPLSSAVPSKPGPDLDSNYNHALPDPPQFVQPHAQEHLGLGSTDAPESHQSLSQDQSSISALPSAQSDHLEPQSLRSEPPVEEGQSVEEEQSVEATHAAPIEHSSEIEQNVEPEHPAVPAEDLHVEESSALEAEPAEEQVAPEEAKPVEEEHVPEPAEHMEDEIVPEPVEPLTAPIEAPIDSEVESRETLHNDIVDDDQELQSTNGIAEHTVVGEKSDEEKLAVGDDWTDLTKPEVQFALCLFALPWTSLLITSRTVNTLIYLIFDWQLVRPVTGLILSIIAPSIVYTSLVAMFISLFSATLQNS